MSESARNLRKQHKDLARLSFRAADVVEARVVAGELGVSIRHDVERLRNFVEVLKDTVLGDAVYLDPDYSDDELSTLAAQLDDRVIALEERVAAGRLN